jgi:hypothetical protein
VVEAQATLWKEPQQPNDTQFDFDPWEQEPAAAPVVNLELFKRQDLVPLSVCGYISGDAVSIYRTMFTLQAADSL